MPPADLFVEFQYLRGGYMSKHDVWVAILRAITDAAIQPWDAQILGTLEYPVVANVKVTFVSSVKPPRYQSKTIIWTLEEVFDTYNEERYYSNGFLRTFIGRGQSARNLGVGSIKSTLPSVSKKPTNSSVLGLSNNSALNPDPSDETLVSESNSSTFQAGTHRLTFVLNYLENGATFSDKSFFALIITLLTSGAQHETKTAPCGVFSAYRTYDDYTLTMGPTSDAARGNLPWILALQALGFLPSEMLKHGPGGRWAELSGRIKLDGAYIGKFSILKGKDSRHELVSCSNAALDPVDTSGNDSSVERA